MYELELLFQDFPFRNQKQLRYVIEYITGSNTDNLAFSLNKMK